MSIKALSKTLMKLTPEVDSTNNLCAAFTLSDPKRAKNAVKPSVSFGLLGSARVKALHKMNGEINRQTQ